MAARPHPRDVNPAGDSACIEALEAKVKADGGNYDAHAALVAALRSLEGRGDALRRARELMSNVFPLPAATWLEWIEDESKNDITDDQNAYIASLFERAVVDYLNVGLWVAYSKFAAERKLPSRKSVTARMIKACGRHIPEGASAWSAYRECISEALPGGARADAMTQDAMTQAFLDELKTPLRGMDESMSRYITWTRQNGQGRPDPAVMAAYTRSKAQLEKRTPFEEKIQRLSADATAAGAGPGVATPALLKAWDEYIEFERNVSASGSRKRRAGAYDDTAVVLLFERAISQCFLSEALWKKYIGWLLERAKDDDGQLVVEDEKNAEKINVLFAAHERATRNCPWSSDVWVGALRTFEAAGSQSRWKETLQRAITSPGIQDASIVRVQLEVVDYWRRRLGLGATRAPPVVDADDGAAQQAAEQAFAPVRMVFNMASESLEKVPAAEQVQHDLPYLLRAYWADFEMRVCGNAEQSRFQWEELIKTNLQDARAWRAYAAQERVFGGDQRARQVYRRAVNTLQTSNWALEGICAEWLRFEREQGTLATLSAAERACALRVEQIANYKLEAQARVQQEAQERQALEDKKRRRAEQERSKAEAAASRKRKREAAEERTTDGTLARDSKDDSTSTTPSTARASKRSRSEPSAGSNAGSKSVETTSRPPTERNPAATAFVLNLSFSTLDDELRSLFAPFGDIAEIRHIRGRNGKSKGYAYIEFKLPSAADAAIDGLHLTSFCGRVINVSKAKPKEKVTESTSKPKASAGPDPTTVFVKRLPRLGGPLREVPAKMEALLRQKFGPCGTVKSVRLSIDGKGKVKNFAFVEFDSPESVRDAVKLTGTHLDAENPGKRTLLVMKSCPPSKKTVILKRKVQANAVTAAPRRKTRASRLAFVPRALGRRPDAAQGGVAKESPAEGSNDASGGGKKPSGGLSNSDFRAMLFSKKR